MGLQSVHALFKGGVLIFADPALAPEEGTEGVVTYLEAAQTETLHGEDPILALRGRGQGERLVQRLWQARREDREHDERSHRRLRA